MERENNSSETNSGKAESPSSEPSTLEATTTLEVKASWLDDAKDCRFPDVLPLRFVKLRLLDSVLSFPNGGSTDSSSSSDQTEDDDLVSSCQTPTTSIFDPFAPNPDDLLLAPKKKKLRDSYLPSMRQLNFDADADAGSDPKHALQADAAQDEEEEEQIMQSVYASLLELIISTQLAHASAENLVADSDPTEAFMTPKSSTLLSNLAETCPPAPVRPKWSLERSSQSICRKLNFGTSLN